MIKLQNILLRDALDAWVQIPGNSYIGERHFESCCIRKYHFRLWKPLSCRTLNSGEYLERLTKLLTLFSCSFLDICSWPWSETALWVRHTISCTAVLPLCVQDPHPSQGPECSQAIKHEKSFKLSFSDVTVESNTPVGEASFFVQENYSPTPGLILICACPHHTAVQISCYSL